MHRSLSGWSLRRRSSFLLAVCVGLVALADFLFFEQPIGWTVGLYAAAVLLAMSMRGVRSLAGGPRFWISLLLLGMIAALVIEPGVLPITLTLIGLVTLAATQRNGWTASVVTWLARWSNFVIVGVAQPFIDARIAQRWRVHHEAPRTWTIRVVQWWLPIVLGITFIALFATANPVIEWGLEVAAEEFGTRVESLPEWLPPIRIAIWLVSGLLIWALLRTRVGQRKEGVRRVHANHPPVWDGLLDRLFSPGLINRCLWVLNGVFLCQIVLDGVFLIGKRTLPEGMGFAEYAHRGAYPLMFTALLAAAMVLVTFRPGGSARRSTLTRTLVSVWIGQNVLLMVAAAWRLNLYVEAYSLTRWRIAAAIWMALVAVSLIWLVWRILSDRSNAWLLQRLAVSTVALLYACCFINFDGFIGRYNVTHSAELTGQGVPIDLDYLVALGPDTLPAVESLADRLPADHPVYHQVLRAESRLERDLERSTRDWRGWTLQRHWVASR